MIVKVLTLTGIFKRAVAGKYLDRLPAEAIIYAP